MPNQNSEDRKSIIEAVRTPLGFFVLVILVIEAGMGGLALNPNIPLREFLIYSIVGILVLLIIIVTLIALFRPEALWGKRYNSLEEYFAEALGKDLFTAFDGYLSNDIETRDEAYTQLEDILKTSKYYEKRETKHFTKTIIDTIIIRAKVTNRRKLLIGIIEE